MALLLTFCYDVALLLAFYDMVFLLALCWDVMLWHCAFLVMLFYDLIVGVTFDSGGISIKPSAGMEDMRADMGGAACTLSALWAAARLNLPINVKAYIPLCENMPSGKTRLQVNYCIL